MTAMESSTLSRRLLWTLTATTVLTCGNVYYSQPLLKEIAVEFHQSAGKMGLIPMMNQLGYVAGLLLITPLGDMVEKRKLVTTLLVLAGFALMSAAIAPAFVFFAAASFFIGLTAVLVQIIIPFVAVLSAPGERGKNLGTLLSGALIGVLISRTSSGLIGGHFGWRAMFWIASVIMYVLAAILHRALPLHRSTSAQGMSYPRLIRSLWELCRDLPELRKVALNGALMYSALSAFWATLAFYLASDTYKMGPEVAGLFGLIGAVGAMSVVIVGRHVERIGPRRVVQLCIGVMIASFLVFWMFGSVLPGLIAGVVLLDLGAQAATVSNQTQIYGFHSAAQTRINTIYKMFYFCGGAFGSVSAALAWQNFRWAGVCGLGVFLLSLAWFFEALFYGSVGLRARRIKQQASGEVWLES